MRNTRRTIFIIIAVCCVMIFSTCETAHFDPNIYDNDSALFKGEYEFYNAKEDEHGNIMRSLDIPEDNPMLYALPDDVINMMSSESSFIVYFGFPQCPWCRANIESLLLAAEDDNIKKIYYVDISDIRDTYEISDEECVKTVEGTDGYYQLLQNFNPVLDDYVLFSEDGIEYAVGEKRIYAPNVIVVKNGVPVSIATDSEMIDDPYGTLSDEMKNELYQIYDKLFRNSLE